MSEPEMTPSEAIETIRINFILLRDERDQLRAEVERLKQENAEIEESRAKYEQVMELLRNLKMKHGTCQPRDRRACTNCNSKDALDELVAKWKGRRIYPSEALRGEEGTR